MFEIDFGMLIIVEGVVVKVLFLVGIKVLIKVSVMIEIKIVFVMCFIIRMIVKIMLMSVNIIVGLERLLSCMKVVGLLIISFVFLRLIKVMNKFMLYCMLILREGGIDLVILVWILVRERSKKRMLF